MSSSTAKSKHPKHPQKERRKKNSKNMNSQMTSTSSPSLSNLPSDTTHPTCSTGLALLCATYVGKTTRGVVSGNAHTTSAADGKNTPVSLPSAAAAGGQSTAVKNARRVLGFSIGTGVLPRVEKGVYGRKRERERVLFYNSHPPFSFQFSLTNHIILLLSEIFSGLHTARRWIFFYVLSFRFSLPFFLSIIIFQNLMSDTNTGYHRMRGSEEEI